MRCETQASDGGAVRAVLQRGKKGTPPAVEFMIGDQPLVLERERIEAVTARLHEMKIFPDAETAKELAARMAVAERCGRDAAGLLVVVTDVLVETPSARREFPSSRLFARFESTVPFGRLGLVLANGIRAFVVGTAGDLVFDPTRFDRSFLTPGDPGTVGVVEERIRLLGGVLEDQRINPETLARLADEAIRRFEDYRRLGRDRPDELLAQWPEVERIARQIVELNRTFEDKRRIIEAKVSDWHLQSRVWHIARAIRDLLPLAEKLEPWYARLAEGASRASDRAGGTPVIWPRSTGETTLLERLPVPLIQTKNGWLLPTYLAVFPIEDEVLREVFMRMIVRMDSLMESYRNILNRRGAV